MADLYRLIEALDRRVPRLECTGEARIAHDAADLRDRAVGLVKRIEGDRDRLTAMARPVPQPTQPPQPARRPAKHRADAVECPRCGRHMAKIIGRSEALPVVYLKCDGCQLPSVAGA